MFSTCIKNHRQDFRRCIVCKPFSIIMNSRTVAVTNNVTVGISINATSRAPKAMAYIAILTRVRTA